MSKSIRIKKGLDIPLEGKAADKRTSVKASLVGIVPDDFEGHTWKCCVRNGDEVAVGTPLLNDKLTGRIKLVSPIEGIVREVRRGERRKILAVTVEAATVSAEKPRYDFSLTPDAIRDTLQSSGLWALMRQRPFDIVPDADSMPRDIFVSAFDSAPLAPRQFDQKDLPAVEKGLEVLRILGGKTPYVSFRDGDGLDIRQGEKISVSGPHPAGNVGVQIAAIAPVNKGETVWALSIATVIRIGKLYLEGVSDWSASVALTGPEVKDPSMVDTTVGVSMAQLLEGHLDHSRKLRIISGNVLTGKKVSLEDGFLRYPYSQVTVLAEGDDADEFMGWASMSPKKFSVKRTFPAFLKGLSKPFPFDSRIKGGRRAMILSGEYDKVFPFDIYPEYLVRAIQAGDIDRMEKLGIYEVAPEDFALPEFVDTSKQELQKMVRDSLDNLRNDE